jgi:hypothetical protein
MTVGKDLGCIGKKLTMNVLVVERSDSTPTENCGA